MMVDCFKSVCPGTGQPLSGDSRIGDFDAVTTDETSRRARITNISSLSEDRFCSCISYVLVVASTWYCCTGV